MKSAVCSSFVLCAASGGIGMFLSHAEPASAGPPGNGEPVLQQVASFNPALGQLPESMTADARGNLFVSTVGGAVFQIAPDHAVTQVATVVTPPGGQLTGIKVGPDGLLYIS